MPKAPRALVQLSPATAAAIEKLGADLAVAVAAGKGVSLHYAADWLANGFALSEDLPLVDTEFLSQGRFLHDGVTRRGCVKR